LLNQLNGSNIIRPDPSKEFFMEEGCYILEILNTEGDPDLSIAMARVLPQHTTRWHRLKGITERYYILNGKGLVELGNNPPHEVNRGDLVCIPPMCPQRIKNIGHEDLLFLAICTPRFRKELYEDIEELLSLKSPTSAP